MGNRAIKDNIYRVLRNFQDGNYKKHGNSTVVGQLTAELSWVFLDIERIIDGKNPTGG